MTRRLFHAWRELHLPWWGTLLVGLGLVLATPVLLVLEVLVELHRRRHEADVLAHEVGRCARGCRVPLVGSYECPCGWRYAGHAFAACPACGARAAYIACSCGGSQANNPLYTSEEE